MWWLIRPESQWPSFPLPLPLLLKHGLTIEHIYLMKEMERMVAVMARDASAVMSDVRMYSYMYHADKLEVEHTCVGLTMLAQ